MKKNMGKLDRSMRIVVGLGIILAGLYFASWWVLVGVILLTTRTLGNCPLYPLFGISTCPTEKKEG